MFFKRFLLIAMFAAVNLPATGRADERLRVLATFAPIYSLTANVAGKDAEVQMLLPADTGPHDFALSPRDLKKLAWADVIVANGGGVEDWLGKALQTAARPDVVRVIASERIRNAPNPHVWLDPVLAITMVETIRDALMARDPAHASDYGRNAAAYIALLRQLDADLRAATNQLPQKKLLTYHDSLACFAARYGFEVVGSVEPFPGHEPTPKYLKQLRTLILQKKVKALFSEPQYSPRILESLSRDLQVPIAVLDPMETGQPSAGLYEKVMRANLKSLQEALGGR